jgi:SAM-dependent methyltransferase
MQRRLGLGPGSLVVEVGSNDGYLLQHFLALGVPVLGIEPARNAARVATGKGIATEVAFFGTQTAERLAARGVRADLAVANNVLAHAPGILDFAQGFARILAREGVASFEFPHLLELIEGNLFDTIYHEHFSYLSLLAVERVFAAAGLRVFDVEELPTHGGSLRLYACLAGASHPETERVGALRAKERGARLHELAGYEGFAARIEAAKSGFLAFLERARREGRSVAAYGAAAKGNTFLGVCGVTSADIPCVFDRSREKQGRLLPGSHLPIFPPERIGEVRPDYLLILPWNLADEIGAAMAEVRRWGGRFVVALPRLRIF